VPLSSTSILAPVLRYDEPSTLATVANAAFVVEKSIELYALMMDLISFMGLCDTYYLVNKLNRFLFL
jgi:hypothetical protein